MKFVVEGEMDLGKEVRKFSKEIEAVNEKLAKEQVYKLIGSNHRLKRNKIKINSVKKEA